MTLNNYYIICTIVLQLIGDRHEQNDKNNKDRKEINGFSDFCFDANCAADKIICHKCVESY